MIETFLLIYAISALYVLLETGREDNRFAAFQEVFFMTCSFVVITHLLTSPNTSYLLHNLTPAIVLTYGVIKRIVWMRKKRKESEDEETRKGEGDDFNASNTPHQNGNLS